MAKATKKTTGEATGGKKKAAKAAPAAPAAAPMVDTNLAAQAAAKRLVAGLAPPMANPALGKESASFKQLKQTLSNPASSGLDSLLDKTAAPGSKKVSGASFQGPGGKQVNGRNQTFGADVNRTGVPRRTSGG